MNIYSASVLNAYLLDQAANEFYYQPTNSNRSVSHTTVNTKRIEGTFLLTL